MYIKNIIVFCCLVNRKDDLPNTLCSSVVRWGWRDGDAVSNTWGSGEETGYSSEGGATCDAWEDYLYSYFFHAMEIHRPLLDGFAYSSYFPAWQCVNKVKRN